MEHKRPEIAHSDLSEPITEFALCLAAVKDGIWAPGGTCVIIAPHLAITAKHVIEEDWKYLMRNDDLSSAKGKQLTGSYEMQAIQVLNEGKNGALWHVQKIWLAEHTDIAFLFLIPGSKEAEEYTWRMPKVQFTPPKIGSTVYGFGYTKTSVESKSGKVEWKVSPQSTEGTVIEIHHKQRDESRGNFPSIHINAPFKNLMSGGPLFNDEGVLVGVISSSIDPYDETEEYASYAALIWPSLLTKIDIARQGFLAGANYPLYDLCKDNFIKCVDLEVLTYKDDKISAHYIQNDSI